MIRLKTIGNATIIAYESAPIFATDPWLNDDEAYFGSWSLSHKIPQELENDIFKCKYI